MDDEGGEGAEQVMTCVASRVFSLDNLSAALLRPKAWWLEDRQAPVNGRKDFSEAGAGVGIRTMKPVAEGGPTCPVR
jgi:hypothetical protein